MRVLVTGAGGFSGAVIARRLAAAGFQVIAHRRSTPLAADLAGMPGVTEWAGDLADLEALPPGIDAVVHAAATSKPRGSADAALIRDNALASARLVAAARAAGVGRFIYLSSLSVHGAVIERSLDAGTPIRAPDPYGVSKLMGESVLAASGLPAISIRLPAVIGPGADRNWPVRVAARIRHGEAVCIYNADGPFNNVVHVDDLAGWIADLLGAPAMAAGMATVPVGSADPIPVRAAVATIAAGLARDALLEEVVAPGPAFTIDPTAAARLGFRPSSTFEALLRYARSLG